MGVNKIRVLTVFVIILVAFHGVHAENPKLIWKKHLQISIERDVYGRTEVDTYACKIPMISLSRDGQLVGYQEGGTRDKCKSGFVVLDSYGTTKEVGEVGYNYKGFSWDDGKIIATKSPTKLTGNVYFYEPNGERIKDIGFDARFSLTNIDVSPNGKFITFIDGNKYISIYDGNGDLLAIADYDEAGTISSTSTSNNGEVAVFVSDETNRRGFVILYDETGTLVFKKEVEFSRGFVKISPDGKRIAVGISDILKFSLGVSFLDNEGSELWRYETGFGIEGVVNDLKIGYDGEYSVVIAREKLIEILNEKGGKEGNYSLNKTANLVSISEKGDYILASSDGGYLYYFDNSANLKTGIVVLANSIDYEINSDFFGFLKNIGLRVTHATADDFDQYKNEKFIVILGGPDAYDGVGEIVRDVLMNSEQNQIREGGSRKMYVKTNVWTVDQRVTVIAGSNRMETQNSVEDNKSKIKVD